MFRRLFLFRHILKPVDVHTRNHQVTVLGAASDIGQTISLLLRTEPSITHLVVHDNQPQTPGVILDLSHVPTNSTVKGLAGEETMEEAITHSEIIIAAGGAIRKPGISANRWLSTNIAFMRSVAKKICRLNPLPFLGIVTEPINSLIPLTSEVMRNHGQFDSKKLFGITNIDILRAQSLYACDHALDSSTVFVPVIGGHSDMTSLPLLSQASPPLQYNDGVIQEFTNRLRKSEAFITEAKRGCSSVPSIAYSALLFTRSILSVLDGRDSSVNAYICNNDFGTEYFSGLVHINENGVKDMQTYENLSPYECHLLERSIEHLRKDVLKGKKILEY